MPETVSGNAMKEKGSGEGPDRPPAAGPGKFEDLPPRWQKRLLGLAPSLLSLGMASVLSAEEAGEGAAVHGLDCSSRLPACRAVCCSLLFALTKDEVQAGKVAWDRERPHLIALGEDGFCTHLDRESLHCLVYEDRPLRCRRYDCRRESDFWEDGGGLSVREGTFDHLP